MKSSRSARPWAMLVVLLLPAAAREQAAAEDPVGDQQRQAFFESRIRPVLVKHCYACHSVQAEEVKGGLLVDSAAGLRRGGDSGPAVVAGQAAESLLLQALRYEGLEMPPQGRLPATVVADFEAWIRDGAWDPREGDASVAIPGPAAPVEAREHWAFQPIVAHDPPPVADAAWPATDLDRFVLARLEAEGLRPNPEAEPNELVRRLYFDLTGLPPTPDELDEALRGSWAETYPRLVDHLLQSPQFGVHWARRWLDVARYADSNGGDFNATFHNAWRYRDYVVDSFNRDKPLDRFVREQIAGDLLPAADDRQRAEQIVATGFLMLGAKMLSERDKEKLTMDVVDEQISAVGSAFMGLTLGCARCHDHKFDPISTRDYYALAGVFRSTRTLQGESQKYVSTWRKVDLPVSPQRLAAVRQFEQQQAGLKGELDELTRQLAKLADQRRLAGDPLLVDNVAAALTGVWKDSQYTPKFVGEGYLHDNNENKGACDAVFTATPTEAATYELRVSYTAAASRASNVPVEVRGEGVAEDLRLDQRRQPALDGLFQPLGRFALPAGQAVQVRISNAGTQGHVIVDAVHWVRLDEQGEPVAGAGGGSEAERLAAEQTRLEERKQTLETQIKDLEASRPAPLPQALAVAEAESIGDCRICIRGEHANLGPEVARGFPEALPGRMQPPPDQSGRLELAQWLASPEHPLTARVLVNRVWMHLMGEGLVRSVDNFGVQGEAPTHPELLDELARRFASPDPADGWNWSLKSLIRAIVTSRAYRLSAEPSEAAEARDPENRLLWRACRRRLSAEEIRDALLACGGQLDLSPGGSPVEGLGVLVNDNNADARKFEGGGGNRRSLYLPIIRSALPSELTVFDFADPDLVVGKRPVTNVPAQALMLLNSPLVLESAAAAAARIDEQLTAVGQAGDEAFVRRAYRLIYSRSPGPDEIEHARDFLHALRSGSQAADDAAAARARWIHVLFASSEFRMLN